MNFLLKTRADESEDYGYDVALEVRSVIEGLMSVQEQLVIMGFVEGIPEDMADFVRSLDFGALSMNLHQTSSGSTVLSIDAPDLVDAG